MTDLSLLFKLLMAARDLLHTHALGLKLFFILEYLDPTRLCLALTTAKVQDGQKDEDYNEDCDTD